MSQTKLRRFQTLFDGLKLGVLESVNVDLGRERLGFFQVPQTGDRTPDQLQRQLRLAAVVVFSQITNDDKPEVLATLRGMAPAEADVERREEQQRETASLQQREIASLQQHLQDAQRVLQDARAEWQRERTEMLRRNEAYRLELLQTKLQLQAAQPLMLQPQWQPPDQRAIWQPGHNMGPYADQNIGLYASQNMGPYADQNIGLYASQNIGPYPGQNIGPHAGGADGSLAPQPSQFLLDPSNTAYLPFSAQVSEQTGIQAQSGMLGDGSAQTDRLCYHISVPGLYGMQADVF